MCSGKRNDFVNISLGDQLSKDLSREDDLVKNTVSFKVRWNFNPIREVIQPAVIQIVC